MDFDVVIATPDAMRVVGAARPDSRARAGSCRIPRWERSRRTWRRAIKNAKAGQVQYRADKAGIVQCTIGRASFTVEALAENLKALVDAVNKSKPVAHQGDLSEEGLRLEHDGRGRARRPGEPVELKSIEE